jgi:hypothetical protein
MAKAKAPKKVKETLSRCSVCEKPTNHFALCLSAAIEVPAKAKAALQASMGPYKLGKPYTICWECTLSAFKVKP